MGWVLRLVESGANGSSSSVDVLAIERKRRRLTTL